MTYLSVKNTKSPKQLREIYIYVERLFLRFFLLTIICLIIFGLSIDSFATKSNAFVGVVYSVFGYTDFSWPYEAVDENTQYSVVLFAQNVTCFVYVIQVICISTSFLQRRSYIQNYLPFRNGLWLAAVTVW